MNKKILSLFIFLSISFLTFFSVETIQVNAASNDVKGIETYEYYYIKNLYTGKYMDVYNAEDYIGTNVLMYNYHGVTNQQWLAIRNSNGTYKFVARCSPTNKVLDVTGTNVDMWTDNNASYQQFTIVRDNSLNYGGTYYIKYGSKYVTGNISTNNVEITTSGGGLNSMWAFEKVNKGDADIYAFNYWYMDGIIPKYYNSTGANNTFTTKTSSMGYYSYAFNNYSSSSPLSYMQYDNIWVHSGHGNTGFMAFRDTDGNWSDITISNINSFPTNQLASARVIITTGCYTAQNTNANPTSSSNNIIYAIYEKGAHFALGWTGSVNTGRSVDWIKNFFNKADEGETVKRCIEHADYWSSCGTKYYYGDTYQKLKH